jgi:hypothetical protein
MAAKPPSTATYRHRRDQESLSPQGPHLCQAAASICGVMPPSAQRKIERLETTRWR